jgi:hypothetical protein
VSTPPVATATGLTKRHGATVALDSGDLELYPGVTGLLRGTGRHLVPCNVSRHDPRSSKHAGGPDASPREPRLLIAGDPLPERLSRSRAKGRA